MLPNEVCLLANDCGNQAAALDVDVIDNTIRGLGSPLGSVPFCGSRSRFSVGQSGNANDHPAARDRVAIELKHRLRLGCIVWLCPIARYPVSTSAFRSLSLAAP